MSIRHYDPLMFTEYKVNGDFHVVRLLMPNGIYPRTSILLADSAIYLNDDICFSIAPYSENKISGDYYSEVEWAGILELRLYAATMLCIDRDFGYCCLYPFRYSHHIAQQGLNISHQILDQVRASLIEQINSPGKWVNDHEFRPQNLYKSFRNITLPKICGGEEYSLRDNGIRHDLLEQIYNSFDIKDYLLIRGVSTLIRSAMLCQSGFTEEAAIIAFISLDASFNIVLRRLKDKGIENPTSEDAMDYIADVFSADIEGKYFEYYYEQRVKAVHPQSRFGIFPHAPILVDDYYDLFNDLSELYAFFISGYVNPKHSKGDASS